ncbi:MAG: hypothetical protein OSA23_03270 [Rhodospirillales bacterium]|nr:hypothetical protein [Rhodospirillales bacterium]
MVSDLSTSGRLSYVGIDNRAAGRTAGYLMGKFSPATSGKVILVVGSFGLNYWDHEERKMGFQRFLMERYRTFKLLNT